MKNWSKIFKILAVLFIAIIAVWFTIKYIIFGKVNFQSIQDYINSFGNMAAIVYIAVFTFRTLLIMFPYSLMVVLGGTLFGPVYGFIYAMLSVFLSATAAFYISRFMGKEFIQKLLKGKLKDMDMKVEQHGFKVIFFMRLSTIFPFDLPNYAAGLTRVKYRDFILGILLGILPETFTWIYFGSNLKNPFSSSFIIAICLLLILIAVPLIIKRVRKSK